MYDFLFYKSQIPKKFSNLLIEDLSRVNPKDLKDGLVGQDTITNDRNSKIHLIHSNNWIAAFIYYYINDANNLNFHYDISGYSNSCIQYSEYKRGCFYDWHIDYEGGGIQNVVDRKLSFSVQLSDSDEYEGGDLQLMDSCTNKTYFAPRELGTIVIFDSKIKHRVRKVKSGCRKSLVGWIVGPRFR